MTIAKPMMLAIAPNICNSVMRTLNSFANWASEVLLLIYKYLQRVTQHINRRDIEKNHFHFVIILFNHWEINT